MARQLTAGVVRERTARLLALLVILLATTVLLLTGRSWAHTGLLWELLRDFVYVCGLAGLGVYLGRASHSPEAAVQRAVRGFALLCAVLACAALAGSEPGWASGAVVASLVVGGLLIAVARSRALTELVSPAERLPAWPWLLAVAAAVLGVIAVGALLAQVLRVEALLWALEVVGGALRYALDGMAYAIGYAGAGLIRGIAWLLSLIHVSVHPDQVPHLPAKPPVLKLHREAGTEIWSGSKPLFTAIGAFVAMGLSLVLVAVALRRFRRGSPVEAMVVEEREALASLRSAAGELTRRLGRRLRGLGVRRHVSLSPAGMVRQRYAELEWRLARAGRPRPPGVTVRDHLSAVETEGPESASPPGTAPTAPPAADIAAVYELARYSAHTIDAVQARRFEDLARAFET